MTNFLPEFITIMTIHLLALMSPGPDFVLVSKNSLVMSRKAGLYSAFGIACGILVHVCYSLVGIAVIVSQSIVIFTILKILGALYIFYLGTKAIVNKTKNAKPELGINQKTESKAAIFRSGFFTNLLNPKVTLFFLAVFSQLISPQTPKSVQAFYGFVMFAMTFLWFVIVAYLFSNKHIANKFTHCQSYIEKFFGVILLLLALRIIFSSFL